MKPSTKQLGFILTDVSSFVPVDSDHALQVCLDSEGRVGSDVYAVYGMMIHDLTWPNCIFVLLLQF